MGKTDIEVVEQNILGIVQSNFAAKIAEINAEKGDDLLVDIPAFKYFSDFYDQTLNSEIFIWFGLDESDVIPVQGNHGTTWNIFYRVLTVDLNSNTKARSQIFRYTRALYEIIEDNVNNISRFCSSPKITRLTPKDMTDIIDATPYKMGGINLEITVVE